MTYPITPGFFVVVGHVSRAYLLTHGTAIQSFPQQTDQRAGRRWIRRPGNTGDIVAPEQLVDSLSGHRHGYGGYNIAWPIRNLSPNMSGYLRNLLFGTGWSARLTIQTFNRENGNWETYNTIGRWPNVKSDAQPVAGGFDELMITFVNSRVAPEGPELEVTFDPEEFAVPVGYELEFEVTVTNIGDSESFDDVILTWTVPDEMKFVTYNSPSSLDVEYSEDGGESYSPSYMDADDVTHVRWTYDQVMDADEAILVNLTIRAIEAGDDLETIFSTETDGDEDREFTYTGDIIPSGFDMGFSSGFGE